MSRILVIEDDEVMNNMLVQLLWSESYEVTSVSNGNEGLELHRNKAFDLVITDIVMPDIDGIEIIMSLRAINKKLPVIAISGGGRITPAYYLDVAINVGADYTFQKPFNTTAFLAAVRECLV